MMTSMRPTPPHSRESSASPPKRQRMDLALNLSDIPRFQTPSPPSNTLLVTNLNDPEIFAQATLNHIRRLIDDHTQNAVHTFSPLKSMRRIIVTFYSVEAAETIRSLLDGERIFKSRIRIYFGEHFPIDESDDALESRLLKAPKADKQFFISPPVSPPVGWESRDEDPPNKDAHAEDLAVALERLNARGSPSAALLAGVRNRSSTLPTSTTAAEGGSLAGTVKDHAIASARKRSSSVLVYDPQQSGYSADLPAIAVEDTTGSPDELAEDGMNVVRSTLLPRTEMPPTDLQFGTSE